jgi:hypothetical protein
MKTILEMDEDTYDDLVVFLSEQVKEAVDRADWDEAQRRLALCRILG